MRARSGATRKRLMDLVGASTGLLLTAPISAAAATAVLLTDGKPVLFRQQRVGLGGTRFDILKFRSMRNGAPGPQVSSDLDPRITRVGAILRKTKIDELPQLVNVLRGEMSLVGPRPEVPRYVEKWPDELRATILSVRPGITDPASIAFRHESELLAVSDDAETTYVEDILPQKATMYTEYVHDRSLLGDLWLLGETVKAVIRR